MKHPQAPGDAPDEIRLTSNEERRVSDDSYHAEVAATWFKGFHAPADATLEPRAAAFMRAYQDLIDGLNARGSNAFATAPLMVAVVGQSMAAVELIPGLMKYTRPYAESDHSEDWRETYLSGPGGHFDAALFDGKPYLR